MRHDRAPRWALHPLTAASVLVAAGMAAVAVGGSAGAVVVAGAAAGFANSGST